MGSGEQWSKGNKGQYDILEYLFNVMGREDNDASLVEYIEALQDDPLLGALEAQAEILGDTDQIFEHLGKNGTLRRRANQDKRDRLVEYAKQYRWWQIARGWYGDTDQTRIEAQTFADGKFETAEKKLAAQDALDVDLVWNKSSNSRPNEIETIVREGRLQVAKILRGSGRTCRWWTQCYHDDCEIRITWPRSGLKDEPRSALKDETEIHVWVFVPVNQSSGADWDETIALKDFIDSRDSEVEKITQAESKLSEIYAANPLPGQAQIDEAEQKLADAVQSLDDTLEGYRSRLKKGYPIYRGTPAALQKIPGLEPQGGIEVLALGDVLDDPREHRLDQPPNSPPLGAPADGIVIRWNRNG